MVTLTQSMYMWLYTYHRDILVLVTMGHTELVTKDMLGAYLDWCKTEEGRQYMKGGSKYKED